MTFIRAVHTAAVLATVLLSTGLRSPSAAAESTTYVGAAPSGLASAPDTAATSNSSAIPSSAVTAASVRAPADDSTRTPSAARLRSSLLHADAVHREPGAADRRNVPLALGLSAVVPGLGQAYNRDWLRSAVAMAVESGLVIGYFVWKSRGQEAEDAYKSYAHQHWDPGRYATWLNDYVEFLEQGAGEPLPVEEVPIPTGIDFTSPATWSAQERQTVRAFFDAVRAVEDAVYHPETGAAFSHNLPYFAEQQYYELIGKYFQFAPGWSDYPAWREGDRFTEAIDPERTGPGGAKPNVQGRFLDYAADHAYANTLLRRASRASAFLVLNHVVAAFDAAISAKLRNDRIDADLALGLDHLDRARVTATLSYRL